MDRNIPRVYPVDAELTSTGGLLSPADSEELAGEQPAASQSEAALRRFRASPRRTAADAILSGDATMRAEMAQRIPSRLPHCGFRTDWLL